MYESAIPVIVDPHYHTEVLPSQDRILSGSIVVIIVVIIVGVICSMAAGAGQRAWRAPPTPAPAGARLYMYHSYGK